MGMRTAGGAVILMYLGSMTPGVPKAEGARTSFGIPGVFLMGAQVTDLPAATAEHGGFAFPDARRASLLLLPDVAQPERLTTALCTGNRRLSVQFARRQTARPASTGRAAAGNFDNLTGTVFDIRAGVVDAGAICFLATEAFLAGGTVFPVAPLDAPPVCPDRERIAAQRNRPVVRCWSARPLNPGPALSLVEFERRGTNALASLAVVDRDRMIFADYQAEYRGPGQDLWRVDDGGELSPKNLDVVFLLQRGSRYAMAVAWSGAEGQSLVLWISETGDRFTEVLRDYWYRAAN